MAIFAATLFLSRHPEPYFLAILPRNPGAQAPHSPHFPSLSLFKIQANELFLPLSLPQFGAIPPPNGGNVAERDKRGAPRVSGVCRLCRRMRATKMAIFAATLFLSRHPEPYFLALLPRDLGTKCRTTNDFILKPPPISRLSHIIPINEHAAISSSKPF